MLYFNRLLKNKIYLESHKKNWMCSYMEQVIMNPQIVLLVLDKYALLESITLTAVCFKLKVHKFKNRT